MLLRRRRDGAARRFQEAGFSYGAGLRWPSGPGDRGFPVVETDDVAKTDPHPPIPTPPARASDPSARESGGRRHPDSPPAITSTLSTRTNRAFLYMSFNGTLDIPAGLGHNELIAVDFFYDNGNGTAGAGRPQQRRPLRRRQRPRRFAARRSNASSASKGYTTPPGSFRSPNAAFAGSRRGSLAATAAGKRLTSPARRICSPWPVLVIDNTRNCPFAPLLLR